MSKAAYIRVYEHQSLRVDDVIDDVKFTDAHNQALERYFGNGSSYFSLIRDGVKFNEHVGVLQTGNLTIEVLPKTDNGSDDKSSWQKFLITMLRAAGIIPAATSTASLNLKRNSILDLYMSLFLQEVRYLMQTGLIRKYRKTEENSTALKGSLQFAQNIRHNLTHAERFYVRHTVYDRNNIFNAILIKTIELLKQISNDQDIISTAAALLLDFPICDDVKVSETLFGKLHFDRKTVAYQKAISMAKLLLLRFHPDVRQGSHEVLALMFDMNQLWEKYVFRMLRKELDAKEYTVHEQVRNDFWQQENNSMRIVKPDIVIYQANKNEPAVAVLDTKWKRPFQNRVDDADLKQMLIYNLSNDCDESALLYPNTASSGNTNGKFIHNNSQCSAIFLPLLSDAQQGMVLDVTTLATWIRQCSVKLTKKRTQRDADEGKQQHHQK